MTALTLQPAHAVVADRAEEQAVRFHRWLAYEPDDVQVITAGIRATVHGATDDTMLVELVRTALERVAQRGDDTASPEPGCGDDDTLTVLAGLTPALDPAGLLTLWDDLRDTVTALDDLNQGGPGGLTGVYDPMPDAVWQGERDRHEQDLTGYARRATGFDDSGAGGVGRVGEGESATPAPGNTAGGA
jgi:hypothetical protein